MYIRTVCNWCSRSGPISITVSFDDNFLSNKGLRIFARSELHPATFLDSCYLIQLGDFAAVVLRRQFDGAIFDSVLVLSVRFSGDNASM